MRTFFRFWLTSQWSWRCHGQSLSKTGTELEGAVPGWLNNRLQRVFPVFRRLSYCHRDPTKDSESMNSKGRAKTWSTEAWRWPEEIQQVFRAGRIDPANDYVPRWTNSDQPRLRADHPNLAAEALSTLGSRVPPRPCSSIASTNPINRWLPRADLPQRLCRSESAGRRSGYGGPVVGMRFRCQPA